MTSATNEKKLDVFITSARLSLAELLAKSMEDDLVVESDHARERERWDEDEGSFGG